MKKRVLECATTDELMDELRRRSLACMAVYVRVDEKGDTWLYSLKGSPLLMGTMSAALSLKITEMLAY